MFPVRDHIKTILPNTLSNSDEGGLKKEESRKDKKQEKLR